MRPFPLSLAALALAHAALAQNITVFPSDFTTVAGDSYETYLPLAAGVSRTQALFERVDLPLQPGRRIQRIGVRQDNNSASTGKSIQLAIYMGGTTYDAATVTSNFANNYNGTARTLVFGPSIVALPDLTSQTTLREIWIQLVTPYTVRANENLLVEYVVTANNNANVAFPYYVDKGTYRSPVTTYGTGCQTSAGQVPTLAASTGSYLGGYLSFSLSRAPASSLVWLNMDFVQTTPLNANRFGAPGCFLYVLPQIAIAAQGNTGGSASFGFPLPANSALFHAQVYAQCAIFDLFANNLGFAFSNGANITLGMYPQAATIYATGNATATTGGVLRNDVVITLFDTN